MRLPDLRAVLVADAAVCWTFGAAFALAPGALASALTAGGPAVLGLGTADALRVLGLAVAVVGAAVWLVARAEPILALAVLPILAVEVAWIAASSALLAGAGRAALTPLGAAVVALGAAAVLAFFVLEVLGLLRARAAPRGEAPA